jgi:hypothetical protein
MIEGASIPIHREDTRSMKSVALGAMAAFAVPIAFAAKLTTLAERSGLTKR